MKRIVDNENSTKNIPMLTRQITPHFTSNVTQISNYDMVNPMITANKNSQAIEIDECRLPSDSPLDPSDLNDQDNNVETNHHMETPFPFLATPSFESTIKLIFLTKAAILDSEPWSNEE